MNLRPASRRKRPAFTLIELLVVVAIIALLISILLPSLNNARRQAKSAKCGANLSQVGKAVATYAAEMKGYFPPSYVYPRDFGTSWGLGDNDQDLNKRFGYLHWSHFLYNNGQAGEDAFQCPDVPNGGFPRTNPGGDASDWESADQQVDDNGNSTPSPSAVQDRQARRMAYTANAAIIPRNKFTPLLAQEANGGAASFLNRLVQDSDIKGAGDVILASEFGRSWTTVATDGPGSLGGNGPPWLSKSHRPTNVFATTGGYTSEYGATPRPGTDGTFYYDNNPGNNRTYGLKPLTQIESGIGLGAIGNEANLIGRHHPGGRGSRAGEEGTANFLYVDGHVERETILSTLERRRWGEKYYSLKLRPGASLPAGASPTTVNKVVDRYRF